MNKTAQKRSVLNQLREKINIPGAMVEGFFKPELDRIMNDLRIADDNIRTILTGQKIGKADTEFTSGKSVKDLLKSARSNFNRREYMMGVAELGEFHKRLADVSKYIQKLDMSVNRIHHNFLFQNMSEDQKQNLQKFQEYMSKASESSSEDLVKEAGIMDFFYNIGTKRGRALAIWEKKYPNVVKDLRDGGVRLLDLADSALSNTLSLLKEMAVARATRKVDDYMEAAKKIEREYTKFDGGDRGFRAYYSNIILPYIKRQAQFEAEEAKTTAPVSENIPIPLTNKVAPPAVPDLDIKEQATPTVPPATPTQPTAVVEEEAPITDRPQPPPTHVAHKNFYASLESMGQEKPSILAKYIAKYATSIQAADPEMAIKLFNIVRKIKE